MKRCCRSDISPVEPGYHGFLCCMMPVATGNRAPVQRPPCNLEDSASLEKVLSSLESLKAKPDGDDPDIEFLKSILESSDFKNLVKVHQAVGTPDSKEQTAMSNHALELVDEVTHELEQRCPMPEAAELTGILSKVHIRGLFLAHDQIAAREYLPHLPEIPYEVDEDEESIKVVRLVKGNNEPLGATIKLDEKRGTIYIARILHGGAADRCGLIHVGDEVQEVNGVSVNGKEPNEVVRILTETAGPITLKLVPGEDVDYGLNRESKIRVRAHFSYDPSDDKHIPCKEAGLAFQKGDILHIVSQDDTNWWQARREGDRNMRAGLIPSKQLQERKMVLQNGEKIEGSPKSSPKHKAHKSPIKSPKFTKKSKKSKKLMYYAIQNEDYDNEEVVTYEEVDKYYPRLGRYRPLVLLGPPGVGRNELKRRLLATNTNHFKSTIPHTSRPQKPDELDGEEYFFLSRNEMDKEIQNKRFVEFGEYKGNLYGTSLEAIKSVVNSGHVAVLCPHPQALKLLRNGELKPYVVLVKPPSLEVLKETRSAMNAKSTFDEKSSRPFTDEEFQDMINSASKLETIYAHCFDQVIINDDLNKAVNELTLAAHRIETEPQWVPGAWMR